MRMVRRIWRSTVLIVTGPIIGLVGLGAVLNAGWFLPRQVAALVSSWHRRRYADLLDEPLVVPAPGENVRRQLAFHLIVGLLSLISFAVVVGCWAFSLVGFWWLSFGWSLPSDGSILVLRRSGGDERGAGRGVGAAGAGIRLRRPVRFAGAGSGAYVVAAEQDRPAVGTGGGAHREPGRRGRRGRRRAPPHRARPARRRPAAAGRRWR